jgi:hypothetical protein
MNINKIVGDHLKNTFFVYLSKNLDLDIDAINNLWDDFVYLSESLDLEKPEPKKIKTPTTKSPKKNKSEEQLTKDAEPDAQSQQTGRPRKKQSISRELQTQVDVNNLEHFKVAELRKINQERGIPSSGNRAALTELLVNYENTYDSQQQKTPKRKNDIKVGKGKTVKDVSKIIHPVEQYETQVDEYGNHCLDDLVFSEEFGEQQVVGYKDDMGDVLPLDKVHIEKCKEMNLLFQMEDFDA